MKKEKIKKEIKRQLKGYTLILVVFGLILGLATGYFLARYNYEKSTHDTNISLIGDELITLKLNETYEDEGFEFIIDGINYNDEVVVTNNINYEKPGIYYITYQLKFGNDIIQVVRAIHILGEN